MSKKFTAPEGKNKDFIRYWDIFLPQVTERDNFHISHLQQLEILCDLYVDYHALTNYVRENGYSFKSDGRYGENYRPHVEVQVRQKVVAEIRAYSKLLGLILDKGIQPEPDAPEWE